ncbi:MAG: cofactor-independent phosphoglycerate mutase [Candidatus Sumerlaeota bacterium]|nr:cofactor-independent phosphoglycerate mutase [Candidatus Sumerlaeota bacterium]
MKRVIFLGDGMSDWPVDSLGGRTPLQVADIPTLDLIARRGRCGIFHTIQEGMPSGSATANLGVLGYDAYALFGKREGRGVFEAASMGVELAPDDLAMRVNLIGLDGDRIRTHSAGHITSPEAAELIEFCNARLGVKGVKLYPGVSYRHLLVMRGGRDEVDCAPPHDYVGGRLDDLAPRAESPEAEATAATLRRVIARSREILPGHPVNQRRRAAGKIAAEALWPWAPGRKPEMATIPERFGVRGAVIAAVDLVFGVGVLAGLEPIHVEGATGLHDTNYEGKADACIEALKRLEFAFVHVEASDEAGHEKNAELKVKTIEAFDRRLVARVLDYLRRKRIEAVVAVLPDHPTPVATGAHVIEPVPVALWDPREARDSVQSYDEQSVRAGALVELRGDQFMKLLMK